MPSLSELISPIEKTGLIVADCETLIHHYDKTLKAWLDRFLKNKEKVKFSSIGDTEVFLKLYEKNHTVIPEPSMNFDRYTKNHS